MGEDLADVMAAAAKDCEEGVTDGAFQGAAREATVGFHVTYLWLNCAAAAQVSQEF